MPYLRSGAHARQWAVRARTFDAFVRCVLTPMAREADRPLRLLDLGAGNGWMSWRATLAGHHAIAVDIRDDDVDGLGASEVYLAAGTSRFERVVASFESLPLVSESADVVAFNASLHYALDLRGAVREARRMVRSGGRLVILDSPFYAQDIDGERMVAEKRRDASARFGSRAGVLMSLPFIEYLTRARLDAASSGLEIAWRRHHVRYPLWYELRPMMARLRGQRVPSRFDLWEARVT
jgi:SAM-dependent methyltransferase